MATTTQSAVAGDRITVTQNQQLQRIMLHEFSTGGKFDPAPLHRYLATLTVQQVRLLRAAAIDQYENNHRLVVFITLDEKGTSKLMCADKCDYGATSVLSSARFAVFHCDGVNKAVELVCYTEEFLLNNGRPKLESRNTDKPECYKISAMNMTHIGHEEGDVIWNRISRVTPGGHGKTIYGGKPHIDSQTGRTIYPVPNAMHGMINTVGCWMLFRNYNWYAPRRTEFVKLYLKGRGRGGWDADDIKKFRQLGYEDDPPNLASRFLKWERNYAYNWFMRDLVGIEYFSNNTNSNDINVDGQILYSSFPTPPTPTAPNVHDHNHPRGVVTDSVWTTNALGFQTANGFSAFNGDETLNIQQHSWADLYSYAQ